MVDAFSNSLLEGRNGYSPSYGTRTRKALALDETSKGWDANENDIYVCHGVTEALQIIFSSTRGRRGNGSSHIILHMLNLKTMQPLSKLKLKEGWKLTWTTYAK